MSIIIIIKKKREQGIKPMLFEQACETDWNSVYSFIFTKKLKCMYLLDYGNSFILELEFPKFQGQY